MDSQENRMTYEEFRNRYRYNPRTDLLGQGSFGKVFRAVDSHLQSTVAIKVCPVNLNEDNYSLKHEFETLKHVPFHINVAFYDECYRLETDLGLYDFAILDYYPLGSLADLIKHQALSATDLHEITIGLLEGLGHLHKHGVFHRDLKPRNVLIQKLRGKFILKIADFGLGKQVNTNNSILSQSFKGGTFNYASPEQMKGEAIRQNTDIWSFGVILFELFTGQIPFQIDDTSDSAMLQVYFLMNTQTFPSSFTNIPKLYASIIKKCLIVNPKERYGKVEDILMNLKSNVDKIQHEVSYSTQMLQKHETINNQESPKIKEKSNLLPIVALVCVIVLAGGYWWWKYKPNNADKGEKEEVRLITTKSPEPETQKIPAPISTPSKKAPVPNLALHDITKKSTTDIAEVILEPPKPKEEEIFTAVEQNAEFPEGMSAFAKFLQKNLRYPVAAQRANVSGKVYIQFVVNTDGSIQNVDVLKSVGFGCDEEAVRVIKSVPKWTPGKQSGRAVRSRFTVPISFVLSE